MQSVLEKRHVSIVCTFIHTAYSKSCSEQLKKEALSLAIRWCIVFGTGLLVLALSDSGTEVSKLPFKCAEKIWINIGGLFLPTCSPVENIKVNKDKIYSVGLKADPLKLNTIHKNNRALFLHISADYANNHCYLHKLVPNKDGFGHKWCMKEAEQQQQIGKILADDVKQLLMWPSNVGIRVTDVVGCWAKLSQMALHQFRQKQHGRKQHLLSQTQHQ